MPSLYKKKTGTRYPSKIIIAVEGHKREKQYFDWFSEQKSRIRIALLEPKVEYDKDGNQIDDVGRVKPMEILDRLNRFTNNPANDVQEFDHIWIVMDADKFKNEYEIHALAKYLKELNLVAKEKNLALSMPCFELWLLLHVADVANGQNWNNCIDLKTYLPTIFNGGFDSTRHITRERVQTAIARAVILNANSTSIVPANPGTKVHELVNILLGITG